MSQVRATATAGALAGCVSIFLALVGLTDRFADLYFVGDEASFGRLMLIIAPFTVGAILAKPRVEGGEVEERTRGGGRRDGRAGRRGRRACCSARSRCSCPPSASSASTRSS